jgi:RNA polymerase sigma factor (sigma-70 family)
MASLGDSTRFDDEDDPEVTRVLLKRVHVGDREALARLYERYNDRILMWVQSQVGAAVAARVSPEDLKQEVVLRSLSHIHEFDAGDVPRMRAWFAQLAERVVIDEARRWDADKRAAHREVRVAGSGESSVGVQPVDAADHPSQAPLRDERRTILAECMRELSDRHRRVLQLRFFGGFSFRQIGAELGCSEEAAAMLLQRAESKLGERLRLRGLGN